MKTISLATWCFAFACGMQNFGAISAEAISTVQLPSPYIGYGLGGAGFAFTPRIEIVAFAVGFRGELIDREAVELAFWDSAGQKLGSRLVSSNFPGLNGTHYTSIPPVMFSPGEIYYLSSCGSGSGAWSGHYILQSSQNGNFTVAPELIYGGSAMSTNPAGIFPNTVFPGMNLAVGPNFQFVPAPFIRVGGLRPGATQMRLDFEGVGSTATNFTLLESAQPHGPWFTNVQAVIQTNSAGSSYTFTVPKVGNSRFYRVQCP